ncbi:hypothetical protein CQW23_18526 [Capsicum baccatum]|uniref:FF domain-containing protein n=1 Tax=Capsicum baccatum TaxID=33114 RepID=A0A2G2W362_CAPBA|nr:hypothetical protein CQW23_18526 [Capsicum baccatum]
MPRIFQFDVHALLDPGFSFSYVTSLIAMNFEMSPEIIPEPILLSTLLSDTIVAQKILVEKSPIPPLAGPAPRAIPSISLQQSQPMLPAQQAQPYGSGSSQQFMPLGHTNVAMSQPSQIQFSQSMQQVTGRPVVGMHSIPQGPPIPHEFQRNLPMSNSHMPCSGGPNLPLSYSYNDGGQTHQLTGENLQVLRDESVYYYNKVTRTSKWRMPDEVKDPSSIIEIVEMKSSSEPASPAVDNSEKIKIAITLRNSIALPVSETTTTQDAVVYGDGFSLENRENVKKDTAITEIVGDTPYDKKTVELGQLVYESKAEAKSAFNTLLESANIGSDCTWDKAMRAVINDWRYGALKSLYVWKQAFNEEHAKALEEQKRNRVEYLQLLKSCDFIKASSQWQKVQDHLETNERFSRLEKIYCLDIFQIKDFAAYLAVSSNTSGSTAKDLFTDVMDELDK